VISAIVLAAGRATRFGSPKVVAQLFGVPLVRHVVDRLQGTSIGELVVVAGNEANDVEDALVGTPARVVVNPDPAAGLSGSVRVALSAIEEHAEAFLIALGDQPLIDPPVIDHMIAAWREGRGKIIVPVYQRERGNPVLFDRVLRAELMLLEGDRGASALFETHASAVYRLTVSAPLPRDVDTQNDLQKIEEDVGRK